MTFTILIDATNLSVSSFRNIGTESTWRDSRAIHTVQLAPDIYQLGQAAGTMPEASFQVRDDGMADSDSGARILADRGKNAICFLLVELVLDYKTLGKVTYWMDIIGCLPAKKRQARHRMPKFLHRCRDRLRLYRSGRWQVGLYLSFRCQAPRLIQLVTGARLQSARHVEITHSHHCPRLSQRVSRVDAATPRSRFGKPRPAGRFASDQHGRYALLPPEAIPYTS